MLRAIAAISVRIVFFIFRYFYVVSEMPSTNIRNFFVANHSAVYKWKKHSTLVFLEK